jgi:hypothetical protein
MSKDVVEAVEAFVSDDPTTWGKLSSEIQFRRLQLLLLREILIALRELRFARAEASTGESG